MQESSVRQGGGDNPVGSEEAAAVARWIWSDSRGRRRLCRTILNGLGNLQGAGRTGRRESRRLLSRIGDAAQRCLRHQALWTRIAGKSKRSRLIEQEGVGEQLRGLRVD